LAQYPLQPFTEPSLQAFLSISAKTLGVSTPPAGVSSAQFNGDEHRLAGEAGQFDWLASQLSSANDSR